VDLSGWVGLGLGENCDCRCGILMLLFLGGGGVVFEGLFSLTSPYSSELIVLCVGWSASRILLYVLVRRFDAFDFLWEREQVCEM